MKANAPEKIYIHPDIGGKEFIKPWIKKPFNDNSIEYIRTDAFIEKACDWFRRLDYDDSMPPFETTEEFIEGFKNYMEGE